MTASSTQEAENITKTLLEERLIACANIVGSISSHFRWEGKLEQTEEFLVLMKSRADLFDELSARVKALHSYEVPEILAIPVVAGSAEYFDWLQKSLK